MKIIDAWVGEQTMYARCDLLRGETCAVPMEGQAPVELIQSLASLVVACLPERYHRDAEALIGDAADQIRELLR